jgi:hypothetical protein
MGFPESPQTALRASLRQVVALDGSLVGAGAQAAEAVTGTTGHQA